MTRPRHSRHRKGNQGCRLAATLAATTLAASPAVASASDRDALLTALDDEYRAEATYQAVIDRFGEVRPFINIIQAEQRHAQMVIAQMQRVGMKVPENHHLGNIDAPDSLLQACETGIEAEIENVALYDRILPTIEDPSIRATLERLQAASRDRHLPAFERCVARGGTPGRGRGGGGGGGGWGRGD